MTFRSYHRDVCFYQSAISDFQDEVPSLVEDSKGILTIEICVSKALLIALKIIISF